MQKYTTGEILRIAGIFTVVFSVVVGLLVTFAFPTVCSILGGIELIALGFLLIIGLVALILGTILQQRNRKLAS